MNTKIFCFSFYNRFSAKLLFLLMMSINSLFSGCASIGHQFPAGQISAIRIGETTQNDIYNMFGAPWRTGLDSGMKTFTYGDYQYNLFEDNSAEDLLIKFDKRGIVSSYTYNTSKRSK